MSGINKKSIRGPIGDELRDCLKQFRTKNAEIVAKLEELSQNIQTHSTGCNIAKTVGASVAGMGSLGVVAGLGMAFAPFTAGLSSIVSVVAGITAGVGSLTTIGTTIADSIISKGFNEELIELAEQRKQCLIGIKEKYIQFSDVFTGVSKHMNIDRENELFENIIKNGIKAGVNAYQLGDKSLDLINEIKALNALNSTATVSSNTAKLLGSIWDVNVVGAVNSGKNLFSNLVMSVINIGAPAEKAGVDLFVKTVGPSVGAAVSKSAFAAVGVVFTVVDVYTLVNDWNKHQPTIEMVQQLIDQLKNEAKIVTTLYYLLTADEFDADIDSANTIEEICTHVESKIGAFV